MDTQRCGLLVGTKADVSATISPDAYNLLMARGWESKSVEQQQESVSSPASAQPLRKQLTPEQITEQHRRDGLKMSRQHIKQQLEVASNPQHREMLERALADLEAQLKSDDHT
jgi:hypothetical protein